MSADLRLTDGTRLATTVVLPDAIGTLAMKALVRTVRTERRDAEDLWRCLEIAMAEGVEPTNFDENPTLQGIRSVVWRELGPGGMAVTSLTDGLQDDAAARLRTRLRALLAEVVGDVR